MDWHHFSTGDEILINKIVEEYMSTGKFDQLRRQLISDVDTKAAYQNVKQRMQSAIATFLSSQQWQPELNKHQLRDALKRHLLCAPFLGPGVSRVLEQSVTSLVMKDVRPDLRAITHKILGIQEIPPVQCKPGPSGGPEKMEISSIGGSSTAMVTSHPVPANVEKVKVFEEVAVPGEEIIELKRFSTQDDTYQEEPMDVDEASCGQLEVASDEESDHSITNQMSPISVGSPSPPPAEPVTPQVKRASDFIGKIPKLKRNEVEPSSEHSHTIKEDNKRKNGMRHERREEKDRERRSDKNTERTSERDRSKTSDYKHRSRDKDKYDREKDKNKIKDKDSSRDKSNDKVKDSSRDKNNDKVKDSSRDKNSDKVKEKSRDKSSDKGKDRSRDKSDDKAKDRPRDKSSDKSKNRSKDKSDDKAKDKSRDKNNDKSKDKSRDKINDNAKDSSRDKSSDKAKDSSKDRSKSSISSSHSKDRHKDESSSTTKDRHKNESSSTSKEKYKKREKDKVVSDNLKESSGKNVENDSDKHKRKGSSDDKSKRLDKDKSSKSSSSKGSNRDNTGSSNRTSSKR